MIKHRYLAIFGCLVATAANSLMGVVINEIRVDEPGATDSNEYFELKGTPGESLDGVWYLVVGEHSSFNNPNGENNPDKGGGVVEFAIDLTGLTIPDDGHFLVTTASFQFNVIGVDPAQIDELAPSINFENSDNVTHVLVRGYTGIEVFELADQYDDLAVDIDDNDDGVLNETLPWTEVIDAVGLVEVPNSANPEEFVYGSALGGTDVGPDGSFTPGMIYRGSDDNAWNIGEFNLLNAEGTGLFPGDDFNGPAVDTPGTENPPSPEADLTPVISGISPTIAFVDDTVTVNGANMDTITAVTVGGEAVNFTSVDTTTLTFTVEATTVSGAVTVFSQAGESTSVSTLSVVGGTTIILAYENFETDLGTFTTVSLASDADWEHRTFGLNGFAQANGFGADTASNDWLISPEIDLTSTTAPTLIFNTARNFDGPDLEVLISTDYDGTNPAGATWTALSATLSLDDYDIIFSGPIDLTAYAGQTVHVAFHYTTAGTGPGEAPNYQVHDFLVYDIPADTGTLLFEDFEDDLGVFTTVSIASNEDWEHRTFGGNGFASISGFGADTASDDWLISPEVNLTDALNPKLEFFTARRFGGPDLEVLISTDYDGTNPTSATWMPIDATLSPDNYELVSSGLVDLSAYIGETIHLAFHYTSTGTASGEGAVYQVHEVYIFDDIIFFEDFEDDLGDFTTVSLASNEDWGWGTFGGNGFADISGFGADTASDDWLISPEIDLTEATSPELTFFTARRFSGPQLEVLISTDYDGANPGSATWNPISANLSQDNYELVFSGEIDLSAYAGQTVHLAFHYVSTGTGSGDGAVYQVHEVLVTEFQGGWVDNPNLSFIYRYTPDWAYSITMGFIYIDAYPYIYNPDFGWFYVLGSDIRAGVWIYVVNTGKWAWLVESNGGFFLYFDGSFNNFLNPIE